MTPSVLVSGSIVVDTIVRPVDEPAWGTTSFVDTITRHLGGNGANTSLALARLGCEVKLLGAAGCDEAADFALSELVHGGVDVSAISMTELPNAATIVLVHSDGRRQFLHRLGASQHAFSAPPAFDREVVGSATHFHQASLFVLPHLRTNAPDTLLAAKEAGLSTSLDTNWDPHGEWLKVLGPCLPHVDVLFLNEDESRMVTETNDPIEAARLLHAHGASIVVQKRSNEGSIICPRGDAPISVKPFHVTAVDSTGAGDCFAAGFLRAWLRGESLESAGRAGNAAGALSVSKLGSVAGLLPPQEFDEWCAQAPS